jgi:hypothetical protein
MLLGDFNTPPPRTNIENCYHQLSPSKYFDAWFELRTIECKFLHTVQDHLFNEPNK